MKEKHDPGICLLLLESTKRTAWFNVPIHRMNPGRIWYFNAGTVYFEHKLTLEVPAHHPLKFQSQVGIKSSCCFVDRTWNHFHQFAACYRFLDLRNSTCSFFLYLYEQTIFCALFRSSASSFSSQQPLPFLTSSRSCVLILPMPFIFAIQ